MSFRFKVNRDEWRDASGKLVKPEELGRLLYEPGDRGPLKRNIKEVQLFEAGPVVFPAYEQTSVGVRSLSEAETEQLVADYARTMVSEDEGERAMALGNDAAGGDAVPVQTGSGHKEPQKVNAHVMEDGNCAVCGY